MVLGYFFIVDLCLFVCAVFAADDKASLKEQELELLRQFDINADYGPCLGQAFSHSTLFLLLFCYLDAVRCYKL